MTAQRQPETGNVERIQAFRLKSGQTEHAQLRTEARELMQDTLNWDLGPFLEGLDEWTTVYTIEFVRQLATAVEVDWQVLLAGIAADHA